MNQHPFKMFFLLQGELEIIYCPGGIGIQTSAFEDPYFDLMYGISQMVHEDYGTNSRMHNLVLVMENEVLQGADTPLLWECTSIFGIGEPPKALGISISLIEVG